jgi:hypothetical protein
MIAIPPKASVFSPEFFGGYFAFIALAPFMRIRIDGSNLEFGASTQFAIFCFAFIFFFLLGVSRRSIFTKKMYFSKGNKIFSILIIVSILSSIFGNELLISAKRLVISFFPAVIVYISVYSMDFPERVFKGFVFGLSFMTSISVCYGVLGMVCDFWNADVGTNANHATLYLLGFEFSQTLGQRGLTIAGESVTLQRFSGFFPNPNGLGIICSICLILLPSVEKQAPFMVKVLMAVMVIGLLLALSRTSLLLLFAAGGYFLSRKLGGFRCLALSTVALCLFGGAVAVLVFQTIPDWNLGQEFLVLGERGSILVRAADTGKLNWFLGSGFGLGAETVFGDEANVMAVHSVFLNAFVETGAVGLISLIVFWGYLIFLADQIGIASKPAVLICPFLAAILVGLFAAQLFDLSITRFHYIHLIFFFLLGLVSAFHRTKLEARQYV